MIIIRPGTGNPVGRAILRAAAGTAAEAHNALYAQPFGQQHRVLKILPKGFGHVRVGMDGVAVRAERRQFQTVFLQYALECGQCAFILQKKGRVAMRLAGIAAAADFHRVHAALGQVLHGAFKGHIAQHRVKNRELHDGGHSFCSPGIRLSTGGSVVAYCILALDSIPRSGEKLQACAAGGEQSTRLPRHQTCKRAPTARGLEPHAAGTE